MHNKIGRKILHITPHLGGGVGHVILGWVCTDKVYDHEIVTLDYANVKAREICAKNSINLHPCVSHLNVLKLIPKFDVVILHFWNHPLLYDFIIRNELPPCRLIIYSHVSGLYAPNLITKKILRYSEKFIYTTRISKEIDSTNDVILSTAGIEHVKNLNHKTQEQYSLGYIGTVDYSKMHPDYIRTIGRIKNAKFLIIGGGNENEIAKSADERFEFYGQVEDVRPYLSKMDVFAYLLNPTHFGTAEQVLQEAMAAGVVPVVLNNKCETTLVEHGLTGLVAKNLDEYISFVELLRKDVSLRNKLSVNAKKYAKDNFSLETFVKKWREVLNKVLLMKKKSKKWSVRQGADNLKSYDIFLESLGDFAPDFVLKSDKELKELFKEPNWQSENKGTPKQYYRFLGGRELERLVKLYE